MTTEVNVHEKAAMTQVWRAVLAKTGGDETVARGVLAAGCAAAAAIGVPFYTGGVKALARHTLSSAAAEVTSAFGPVPNKDWPDYRWFATEMIIRIAEIRYPAVYEELYEDTQDSVSFDHADRFWFPVLDGECVEVPPFTGTIASPQFSGV